MWLVLGFGNGSGSRQGGLVDYDFQYGWWLVQLVEDWVWSIIKI